MWICINPKNYKLTKYKRYNSNSLNDDKIEITNDKLKNVNYSRLLFRDIPTITLEEFREKVKLTPGNRTLLVNVLTGELCTAISIDNDNSIIATIANNVFSTRTEDLAFAWKLGICLKDEKIPEPKKVLINKIKKDHRIIYKGESYVIGDFNGKDNVILHEIRRPRSIRVKRQEIINNEECYKLQ